jgi:cell division protein FtsZ
MGAAIAQGENRAVEAAQKANSSPLLEEVSINGARGVLINITGGPDLSLHEVNEAATLIQEEAHDEANIIFGAVIDESMGDEVRITVIATGFGEHADERQKPGARETKAATDGRPVRRLGTIAEDELDVPTWQRRRQEPPLQTPGRGAPRPAANSADEGGDEYDVPTFLRRGAE